jgi:hypothetical protein
MDSLSANLGDFLHSIHSELTRPQKKFLRDGLVGLIRAGRPIVCRMARKLPDQRTSSSEAVLGTSYLIIDLDGDWE